MRLFFALWPPAAVAEQLSDIANSVSKQLGGKATRLDTIHLTLAFLGDVPEERLPLLIETARRVHATPFALQIDGLGYWHRNHLLWAGSLSPCGPLEKLIDNLQTAIIEAGFIVANHGQGFTPHISLIRKLPDPGVPQTLPSIDPIKWHCSSFALLSSKISETGSSYRSVSDFTLSSY